MRYEINSKKFLYLLYSTICCYETFYITWHLSNVNIFQCGLLAGGSNEKSSTKVNASDYHLMNIFKPWCQSNNASIPDAIEKVYDAIAELSDAMSQVSSAMTKVLTAVLLLPTAFVSSNKDGIIDTSIAKDVNESYQNIKHYPSGKAKAPQKDLIEESKPRLKVL